ncbi:hypothetical protein ACTID9_00895 [Brevibacillus fluminis]|uniref:hypothetical protein n=1 Tax=Brevibacillus fluminis TaxID=511487 RepID=UPI003F8AF54D
MSAKSFYVLIEWKQSSSQRAALDAMEIPYIVEIINGQVSLVFPDLPVRQFARLQELFGEPGRRYPR